MRTIVNLFSLEHTLLLGLPSFLQKQGSCIHPFHIEINIFIQGTRLDVQNIIIHFLDFEICLKIKKVSKAFGKLEK